MKYQHLFWDFDGTLYDSYPQSAVAMAHALAAAGAACPETTEIIGLMKVSVFHAVQVFAKKHALEEQALLRRFREESARILSFPAYDGLQECLTALKQAGACHWLYTHRDCKAWEQLEQDGLKGLFSGGVTAEDGFPMKPAPDALLALMERNDLNPKACAMIGDRDIDIQSGQNAGMAGILFDPEGHYRGMSADGSADSLPELTRLLLADEEQNRTDR